MCVCVCVRVYVCVMCARSSELRLRPHFPPAQDDSNPDRYLKWAQGFLVVYSITSRASLERARRHLETLAAQQRLSGPGTQGERPVVLVGNKMDLERYRWVGVRAWGREKAEGVRVRALGCKSG